MVQRAWPVDSDCHFRVRRNPRAPPLPPRSLPPPEETPSEDEEPSRALSALSLEAEGEKRRYSPVYKFPSISYCRETKNDYLYIWLAVYLARFRRLKCRAKGRKHLDGTVRKRLLWSVNNVQFCVKCKYGLWIAEVFGVSFGPSLMERSESIWNLTNGLTSFRTTALLLESPRSFNQLGFSVSVKPKSCCNNVCN